MESNNEEIIMYGTTWCGDTRRARSFFDRHQIAYKWIDINLNAEGRAFVEKTNGGKRSVPTIVFPDGSILVEPSSSQLAQKLGISD